MSQLTNPALNQIIAQHDEDAKDLTRVLPASKRCISKGLALILPYHFVKLA